MACPFGAVVAGTRLYPDEQILYASNVVANLLDPHNSSEAWSGDVRKAMSAAGFNGLMLGGGGTRYDEEACYSISTSWKCYGLKTYEYNHLVVNKNDQV